MELETFFANYPEFTKESEYSLFTENDFNKIIFQKKEFNDLKLSELQQKSENSIYYDHQKIITRFLASYTMYDELFLFHSPGTGKTISAISCIENILDSTIKKALVIVPNETLVEKFKSEIIFTGTKGKYFPPTDEEDENIPYEQLYEKRLNYGKRMLKKHYWITTHERFFKKLKITHIDHLKTMYSNSVIVIDEVHRISTNPEWCNEYDKFLHSIENRKILLMSGTPMKNNAEEIIPLMNLILPKKINSIDQINQCIGRISYLTSKPNIPYIFRGESVPEITYPIVFSEMSDLQTRVTKKITGNDDTFYKNSLQASLFVYRDESYGMSAFESKIRSNKNRYFMPEDLVRLRGKSVSEKLDSLSVYSNKFVSVIRELITYPKQNAFVYTYFMKGGGAILFGLCLELFGYTRAFHGGEVDRKGKRYAILSDSIGTNVNSILKTFNSPKNKNGEYIQVLIGGKQVEEGITFYSIQQIHILTPTWNFSSLDQAIARGLRMRAHRYLEPGTPINIYLHASKNSIDFDLYKKSQEKDYEIKQVEYAIKINSFDCGLTYNRNCIKDESKNNSRECNYRDCLYRCNLPTYYNEEKKDYIVPPEQIDKTTYQLYFADEYKAGLIKTLQSIFRTQFSITLSEILECTKKEYTLYQIFESLFDIIRNNTVFINKYGFESYLHEHKNVFYLTNTMYNTDKLSIFYAENPVVTHSYEFLDTVDYLMNSEYALNQQIVELHEMPFDLQIKKIPEMNVIVQESFIENAIIAKEARMDSPLVRWILNYYDNFIKRYQGRLCSTFLGDNNYRLLNHNGEWITMIAHQETSQERIDLIESEKGIYGFYNNKNKFTIVNLSTIPMELRMKESTKRGKVCSYHQIPELLDIMRLLEIPIPEDKKLLKKTKLCEILQEYFNNNNLIINE